MKAGVKMNQRYVTRLPVPCVSLNPRCQEKGGESMVAVHLNAVEDEEESEVSFQAYAVSNPQNSEPHGPQ